MSLSILFLWVVSCIPLLVNSISDPRGYLLDCGAGKKDGAIVDNLKYITDEGFISVGNITTLKTPNLVPILSTLRYFPDTSACKYCYVVPVVKGGKYLVRTTYYYGGFDGGKEPPVFDQIVEGTKWSVVNTTEDYANGLSSYYEIMVMATGKMLSFCLARNEDTKSSPFISALELEYMDDSLYNTTDFKKFALATVARSSFGSAGDSISFPDDEFNRLWQPFKDMNPIVESHVNITPSDFWNMPPEKAFYNAITTSRGKTLQINWPQNPLSNAKYYISLYFQDNRTPSPYSWRVFNVSINGKNFFSDLNVTTDGVTVYSTQWPLSGQTQIVLTPRNGSPVGPVINAGEIMQILPLGGKTLTRDVVAMEELARMFNKPPSDWSGDPCLPKENSWTGVTCSHEKHVRVVALNLTGMEMSGTLPSKVAKLSALNHLWLGGNNLSGKIPEMGSMKELKTLHLENNKFEGKVPKSLGQLPKLKEIFLQNNKLSGEIPSSLQKKKGIKIRM
ncbi:probable LRR receptor-like serine/threonine-protein kinase At1g67720 isoform X1 [Ziziphus jujuba]|uniref:Probable LRR receptor-like serine/threonine-protein kinase At1g67720 isoform X1 n=2 Tax=Ziziphus jujuba TaxID=326968 RepID=A0ABM4A5K3_ZIZJJ|nr:probable LRR receptor-like serine/threonine-protein kinase At1g67720 isoform X1 [Ziziphus jujuba]